MRSCLWCACGMAWCMSVRVCIQCGPVHVCVRACLWCMSVPCLAVPCRAVPCRLVPCRAVLRRRTHQHSCMHILLEGSPPGTSSVSKTTGKGKKAGMGKGKKAGTGKGKKKGSSGSDGGGGGGGKKAVSPPAGEPYRHSTFCGGTAPAVLHGWFECWLR